MLVLRPVTSTNIRAIGHDGFDLYVLFSSDKLYCYQAVPAKLVNDFMTSPSKGKFLNDEIKPNFSCRSSTESYVIQATVRKSILSLLPGVTFGF